MTNPYQSPRLPKKTNSIRPSFWTFLIVLILFGPLGVAILNCQCRSKKTSKRSLETLRIACFLAQFMWINLLLSIVAYYYNG